MVRKAVRQRQADVIAHGTSWEMYVADFLTQHLQSPYETFINPDYKKKESIPPSMRMPESIRSKLHISTSTPLWAEVSLSAIGDNRSIFGDVDVVVVKNDGPIVIVSCKLSLHGRLTETLFYSILYKQMGIRVVLATPDKGSSGKTEWGTPSVPSKDRLLARRFLSGVYIEYFENHPQYPAPSEKAEFGDIVRHLDRLPRDIIRWCP